MPHRGRDTGVLIGRSHASQRDSAEVPTGARPEQIIESGLYDSPRPEKYEQEMLRLLERGRDRSGRIIER